MRVRTLLLIATIICIGLFVTNVYVRFAVTQSDVFQGKRFYYLHDDLMISMRYAYNFAHGNGLVWNVDERVQGITNLGWTLYMTLVQLFISDKSLASVAIIVSNCAITLATVFLVMAIVLYHTKSVLASVVSGVSLSVIPSFVSSGAQGLEQPCIGFLLAISMYLMTDVSEHPMANDNSCVAGAYSWKRIRLCFVFVILALAVVIRLDAVVYLPVAAAYGLWNIRRLDRRGKSAVCGGLSMAAMIIAGVLLFQKMYYGEWMPNTAVLKASQDARQPIAGLQYIKDYVVYEGGVIPLAATALLLMFWRHSRKWGILWLPVGYMTVTVLYAVLVGGDVFGHARFFVPVMPAGAIICGYVVAQFREKLSLKVSEKERTFSLQMSGKPTGLLALEMFVLFSVSPVLGLQPSLGRLAFPKEGHEELLRIAEVLSTAQLSEKAVVGVFWAGLIPYICSDIRFHDCLGKNDKHIARVNVRYGPQGHNKWDYGYSLGVIKPDLLMGWNYDGCDISSLRQRIERQDGFGIRAELYFDPIFVKMYLPNRIRTGTSNVALYARSGSSEWKHLSTQLTRSFETTQPH